MFQLEKNIQRIRTQEVQRSTRLRVPEAMASCQVMVVVVVSRDGQSYHSKGTLQDLLKARVRGVYLDFAHLGNVLDWKLMESQRKMPHMKYIDQS